VSLPRECARNEGSAANTKAEFQMRTWSEISAGRRERCHKRNRSRPSSHH
jgi:hypothetical protein